MLKLGWSRRSFIKNTSLFGGYVATASAISHANELVPANKTPVKQQFTIRGWGKDQSGLPLFRYIAKPLKQRTVKDFKNPA